MSYQTSTKANTDSVYLFTQVINNLDEFNALFNRANERTRQAPIHILSFEKFCKQKSKERKKGFKKLRKIKPSFFCSKGLNKDSAPKFEFKSSLF